MAGSCVRWTWSRVLRSRSPRAATTYVGPAPGYVPQVDVYPGPQVYGPTYRSPNFYGGRFYRAPYYYYRPNYLGRPYYYGRPYHHYNRPYYRR